LRFPDKGILQHPQWPSWSHPVTNKKETPQKLNVTAENQQMSPKQGLHQKKRLSSKPFFAGDMLVLSLSHKKKLSGWTSG